MDENHNRDGALDVAEQDGETPAVKTDNGHAKIKQITNHAIKPREKKPSQLPSKLGPAMVATVNMITSHLC